MQRHLHVLLSIVLLASLGCSTTNDVVGRGPLQKRKYRPGWNIDIAGKQRSVDQRFTADERTARLERKPVRSAPWIPLPEPTASLMNTVPPVAERASTAPAAPAISPPASVPIGPMSHRTHASPFLKTGPVLAAADQTDGIPRVNRMAMVSGVFLAVSLFVFALSGAIPLFTYLMVFTFITGVIGLLLAIKHRDLGKGIAIAAILVALGFLVASLAGADLP